MTLFGFLVNLTASGAAFCDTGRINMIFLFIFCLRNNVCKKSLIYVKKNRDRMAAETSVDGG